MSVFRSALERWSPLMLFVIVGGVALAQSPGGRTFPYAGFLEENGIPVNGQRDVRLVLFPSDTTSTACDTQNFSAVDVVAGRFSVSLAGVPDACLTTGELFLEVAVGPVDGTLVDLSTGVGSGRASVAATPFAAAAAAGEALLAGTGGIIFERLNGQTELVANANSTAIVLRPTSDVGTGNIFAVQTSSAGNRLLVSNDAVSVSAALNVTGAATLGSTLSVSGTARTGALTTTANSTLGGGTTTFAKSGTVTSLFFPSVTNDPGRIDHEESPANTGILWLTSSDDWDTGSTADKIIFGERASNTIRHEFDAAGNAEHGGDLIVGGAVSSTCPADMTRLGEMCINNARNPASDWTAAVTTCHNQGKSLCSYDDYMLCDILNPTASTCTTRTGDSSVIMWTNHRHGERSDFDESWASNIACYRGNRSIEECSINENLNSYCCIHGVFSGTP